MSAWTRPIVGLATLAIALAACGGGASPAPSSSSSSSAAPSTPAATDAAATPSASATGQGSNISGAAAALAELDSYHLRLVMKMEGLEESTFGLFGEGLEMEGTFIFRPTRAADIAISMGAAAQKTEMGYRLIGDEAWVRIGDSWMVSSADDAQKTIESFAPDKLLGSFEAVPGLTAVGDETKNGVATTHYTAPGDLVGASMGSTLGLADATWTVDFWVAKEAGYAVSYAVIGKGASGSLEMTLDVSGINDPANAVEKPDLGG